jgi:hypothetical protein
MVPGGHEDVPSKNAQAHERDYGTELNVLYVVSAGGSFVGEAGAVPLSFFPALAAYALNLHDAQTKLVDCRRTAASKDIGDGMGMYGCDGHAFVTSVSL